MLQITDDIFESRLEYCEDTMSVNHSFEDLLYQTDTDIVEIPTNGDYNITLQLRLIEQND